MTSWLGHFHVKFTQAGLTEMKPKPPVDQLAFGKIFTGQFYYSYKIYDLCLMFMFSIILVLTSLNIFLFLFPPLQTICWPSTGLLREVGKLPRLNLLPTSASTQAQRYPSWFHPKSILTSVRCYTMLKSCLRAWRPTEVWMGRSGCSGRCTTWPGWTWRPQEPASLPLTGTSWWSASGSWWWSTRSGCPTTPPPPSTSDPPWSGQSPPLEWLLLAKPDSLSSSVLWDPTTPLDSSQWTFWQTHSMFEPGLAAVASLRWDLIMHPPYGHRLDLLQSVL